MSKPKKPPVDTGNPQVSPEALEETIKRLQADYHNLERRRSQENQQLGRLITSQVVLAFLPIIDNLERAATHFPDPSLKLITDQAQTALSDLGVETINPSEVEFDGQTMECVEVIDGPDNQVIKVNLTGYRLGELVIRPAQVVVGKTASDTSNQANKEESHE